MVCILLVEDDIQFNKIVCSYLSANGYNIVGCHSVSEAFEQMDKMAFDIIISDIMMKDIDGFEFVEQVRLADKDIPFLFLTAREDIKSKAEGYRLSIDDYIVKPVEMKELVFRIEAVLRRANIQNKKTITLGDLFLNSVETAAYFKGENLGLSVKEFNLLFKFLSYPKQTFTRIQLMNEFWGFESESNPRTVDVSITKLRNKISVCKDVEIVTVHGLGYKAVISV